MPPQKRRIKRIPSTQRRSVCLFSFFSKADLEVNPPGRCLGARLRFSECEQQKGGGGVIPTSSGGVSGASWSTLILLSNPDMSSIFKLPGGTDQDRGRGAGPQGGEEEGKQESGAFWESKVCRSRPLRVPASLYITLPVFRHIFGESR